MVPMVLMLALMLSHGRHRHRHVILRHALALGVVGEQELAASISVC